MTALLLAVPLVLSAPVPKVKEPAVLDGAWRLTAITVNGRAAGGNLDAIWRFDKGALDIEDKNGSTSATQPIRSNPKATPPEFEFGTTGHQLGVYEIQGDTLRIAVGVNAGTRPAKTAEPNAILYTLTRVKAEK